MKYHRRPTWLPLDWTVEIKFVQKGPSRGSTYKCYTETATGKRLYSRPKVLAYLLKCGKLYTGNTSQPQVPPYVTNVQQQQQQKPVVIAPAPSALTKDEWNKFAAIYNTTVSGDERFPPHQNGFVQPVINSTPRKVWNVPDMEDDDDRGKVIIMSSSEMESLMDEMLSTAAAEQQAPAELAKANSQPKKRVAEAEPEQLQMLLADNAPPRKTGPRSARKARRYGNIDNNVVVVPAANSETNKLAPPGNLDQVGDMENVNGPLMEIDKVEKPVEPSAVENVSGPLMDTNKVEKPVEPSAVEDVNGLLTDTKKVEKAIEPSAVEYVSGPLMDTDKVEKPIEPSAVENVNNGPLMDIDKVEKPIEPSAMENAVVNNDQGENMEPVPTFHKDVLSKRYIEFVIKVLGCEYEVTNDSDVKKLHDEAISSDPFLEYACATAPDPSEVPKFGYNFEKQLLEFERDFAKCLELPFGFSVAFKADVSVHFQDSPPGEPSSSVHGVQGDQSEN